MILADSANAR